MEDSEYTIISYDADGNELSVFTGSSPVSAEMAQQWLRNSLDLDGTVRSAAFLGQYSTTPADVEPAYTLTQEERKG